MESEVLKTTNTKSYVEEKPAYDNTTPQKNYMEEKPEYKASGFAIFLRVIAVATIIASLIIGHKQAESHNGWSRSLNESLYAVYVSLGVLSAIGWWALSYIVDACIKYLKKG